MFEQLGLKEDIDLGDQSILETENLEREWLRRGAGIAGQEDGECRLPVRARRNVDVLSGRWP
jgi:hypothetical protein